MTTSVKQWTALVVQVFTTVTDWENVHRLLDPTVCECEQFSFWACDLNSFKITVTSLLLLVIIFNYAVTSPVHI